MKKSSSLASPGKTARIWPNSPAEEKGWRGAWHQTPDLVIQHRPYRSSLSRPAHEEPGNLFCNYETHDFDSSSLIRIVQSVQPDEIYNLAAQSSRGGVVRGAGIHGRFHAPGARQVAGGHPYPWGWRNPLLPWPRTSELKSKVQKLLKRETTPFYPRSPLRRRETYAYWITVNYREAYGIYACNGILFNHESPVRGE